MNPHHVITLAYHRISRRPLPAGTWVKPGQLDRHLAAIGLTNRSFLTADEFLAGRPGVLVTFDDGTEDLFTFRAILTARRVRPAVFVPVDRLGRTNAWEWGIPGRRTRHLDRFRLHELASLGWEIGLHGSSHRPLVGLSDLDLSREVAQGKDRLEQVTGRPARLFSYPFGLADRRARDAVARAGFAAAFVLRAGWDGRDLMSLPRRPVYCIDSDRDVWAKVTDPGGRTFGGRWQLWKEGAAHGVGRLTARFSPAGRPGPAVRS